jgi:hypothetical protein
MSSVYDRAREGAYQTKLTHPERVKEPPLLRKAAKDLTPEDIESLPAARAQFKADTEAYRKAKTAYYEDVGRLAAQFQADLEKEHGMTNHPKAPLLWEKAYAEGHGAGLTEVALVYENLVELVQ